MNNVVTIYLSQRFEGIFTHFVSLKMTVNWLETTLNSEDSCGKKGINELLLVIFLYTVIIIEVIIVVLLCYLCHPTVSTMTLWF